LLAGLLLSTVSCGYTMSGQSTGLPSEIRTIALPVLTNDSLEPNIESALTRSIIEEFLKDGRLKIVPENRADAVLTGTIKSYRRQAITFDPNFNVTSYRTYITINFNMRENVGKKTDYNFIIFDQVDYRVTSSLAATETARTAGLEVLGKLVGQKVIGTLLERF